MKIKEIQDEIVDEFSMFDEWDERYQYVIDLGKSLPLIEEQYKTEEYKIKGCQSNLWLHSEFKDGKVIYTADSNGSITKGIISVLIRVFSNQTPEDILKADLQFIKDINLQEHLAMTRSNGLDKMIKQIKYDALAFSLKK